MPSKALSVAAIECGTVIDHIPAGQALPILRLLAAHHHSQPVRIGLNLRSPKKRLKDLIKMENRHLTAEELHSISVFAPQATVNRIQHYSVQEKTMLSLPQEIIGVLRCPNSGCITHLEPIASHFSVIRFGKRIRLACYYCEQQFDRARMAPIPL